MNIINRILFVKDVMISLFDKIMADIDLEKKKIIRPGVQDPRAARITKKDGTN